MLLLFWLPWEEKPKRQKRTRHFSPTDYHALGCFKIFPMNPATTDATSEWNRKPLQLQQSRLHFHCRVHLWHRADKRPRILTSDLPRVLSNWGHVPNLRPAMGAVWGHWNQTINYHEGHHPVQTDFTVVLYLTSCLDCLLKWSEFEQSTRHFIVYS